MNPYIFTGLPREIQFLSRLSRTVTDHQAIIDATCRTLEISKHDILSPSRKRNVSEARNIAIGLILQVNPGYGLKKLGELFNRDHSTMIHSRELFTALYNSDKSFTAKVNQVLNYV